MTKPKPRLEDEAVTWLKGHLSIGPCEVGELMRIAARLGFGSRTVERAKTRLGIKSTMTVTHTWSDPSVMPPKTTSAPVSQNDTTDAASEPADEYAPDWTAAEATEYFTKEATRMRLVMDLEDDEIERKLVANWSRFKQPITRADIARIARS